MTGLELDALRAELVADTGRQLTNDEALRLVRYALRLRGTTPLAWVVAGEGLVLNHFVESHEDAMRLVALQRKNTCVTELFGGQSKMYNMLTEVAPDVDE